MAPRIRGDNVICLDGKFQPQQKCTCTDDNDLIDPIRIALAEFPLYSKACEMGVQAAVAVLAVSAVVFILTAIFNSTWLIACMSAALACIIFAVVTAMLLPKFPQLQHRHVCVELKCRRCSHSYNAVFDCITLQKRKRYGYYERDCSTLHVLEKQQTWAFIEAAYDEMRDGLDKLPTGYNCKHWADDMYKSIS